MFKNLLDFSYKRTALQALGFYIIYTIGFIIIALGISETIVFFTKANPFDNNFLWGALISTFCISILSFLLSLIIICKKKLYYNFLIILLAIFSLIITLFLGNFVSCIIPAVLTTFDNKNVKIKKEENNM